MVHQEGTKVFSGGADNAGRMLDLQANPNQPQQVAQHDAPIKVVKYIETPSGPILITGSWDKTVKVRAFTIIPIHPWSVAEQVHLVLESGKFSSYRVRSLTRTMLHSGCSLSSYGRWLCGETYPNIQSHEPERRIQG
jgi:WD40 repeat protein